MRGRGQKNPNLGAVIFSADDTNFTLVKLHQRLCNRQSEARSISPPRSTAVDLAKGRQRDFDFAFAHTDAGVGYDPSDPAIVQLARLQSDLAALGGELDGVGKKVGEDLAQLDAIGPQ